MDLTGDLQKISHDMRPLRDPDKLDVNIRVHDGHHPVIFKKTMEEKYLCVCSQKTVSVVIICIVYVAIFGSSGQSVYTRTLCGLLVAAWRQDTRTVKQSIDFGRQYQRCDQPVQLWVAFSRSFKA